LDVGVLRDSFARVTHRALSICRFPPRHDGGGIAEYHVDLTTDQVGEVRQEAFVGYMQDVDAASSRMTSQLRAKRSYRTERLPPGVFFILATSSWSFLTGCPPLPPERPRNDQLLIA